MVSSDERVWTVYEHIFPNNKRYIGITSKDVKARWLNGNGYKNQFVGKAIIKFGWDNVKHKILFTKLNQLEAESKERFLIKYYNTQNDNCGYNIDSGGITRNSKRKRINHGKEFIKDSLIKDLSDYAVFCMVNIYMFKKKNIDYPLDIHIMYNFMMNKPLNNHMEQKYTKSIKEGMEELKLKKWIEYERFGNIYKITNIKELEDNSFFTVPLEYINKILRENNGIKLLHHYLYLISTINLESGIGFANRETMANNLHINSLKTITQRNKKLVELGVITFKERKNRNIDGTWNTLSNIYSLPENNSNLIEYLDKELDVNDIF